ncbi:MAG: hypothetical protein ACLQCB_22380 [Spirochaetia bacterium]
MKKSHDYRTDSTFPSPEREITNMVCGETPSSDIRCHVCTARPVGHFDPSSPLKRTSGRGLPTDI